MSVIVPTLLLAGLAAGSAPNEYVEQLGQRLAPHLPPATYRFDIVADERNTNGLHEPRTLLGGRILVPAGLFSSARGEAEFAGMIAHAMAHVAASHLTRTETSGHFAGIPLIFIGGWDGTGASGRGTLLPAAYLKLARANELEADRLAAEAMAGAGYDPAALARYIRREQTEPAPLLPPREGRLAALDAIIAALPPATYSEGPDFARIRDEVRARRPPEK
jgi:predicted Zn-dependent protease